MPSGVVQSNPSPSNPTGLSFRAVYEAPWGGVNSSMYPTDIPANDFVQCDNLVVQNGVLVTVSPNCPSRPDGSYVFILDGSVTGAYILYVFNCANYLCCLDQFGNTYTYTNTGAGYIFVFDFANPVTPAVPYGNRPVQVINNIAYIPMFNVTTPTYQIMVYSPGLSFTAGNTGYAVGLHLNVLSGYLLQFNSYQILDGFVSSRVNWSGAFNYTEFDAAVDETAGFNTLTDSAAEITGSFSMGNVGYILRTEGITQMTPTAIAEQPFDFTTLWTSKFGIGSNYSSTVAQFGNFGFFVSEADVFVFNGAAPQGIAGTAKAAIYNDVNSFGLTINEGIDDSFPYLSGDVAVYNYYNPTPAYYVDGYNAQADLYYILALATGIIAPNVPTTTDQIIIWQYSVDKQRWTRALVSNTLLLSVISDIVEDTVTSCSGTTEVVTVNYSEHDPFDLPDLPTWEAATYYSASLCILVPDSPGNAFLFKLTTPGLCGATVPSWVFTPGSTTTDGTAVWTCIKRGVQIAPTIITSWQASTVYNIGDSIFYDNSIAIGAPGAGIKVYECTQAGTSNTTIFFPQALNLYDTATDGSVIWTCVAREPTTWAAPFNNISSLAPVQLSIVRLIEGSNGWSQRPFESNVFDGTHYFSSGLSGSVEPTFGNSVGSTITETGTQPASWQAVSQTINNTIPAMYLAPFAYINFVGNYTTASVSAVPISFPLVLTLGNEFNSLFQYIPPTPFTLVFKQEEFKMGRQPSVVRVVFRAQGLGTINVQVGNKAFSTVTITNSTSVQTYTSSGIFTGEVPQLTLSSAAFKGIIVKAMMVGKFSDGEYD